MARRQKTSCFFPLRRRRSLSQASLPAFPKIASLIRNFWRSLWFKSCLNLFYIFNFILNKKKTFSKEKVFCIGQTGFGATSKNVLFFSSAPPSLAIAGILACFSKNCCALLAIFGAHFGSNPV
ncbi:MAG: hypothetical protein IKK80_05445 [Treponema sp.]|nr:hypothetical protein [Treponema sp.]